MRAKFKGACVKAGTIKSLQQANGIVLLDPRLYAVSFYPTLKIFQEYSQVKQRDGSESVSLYCNQVNQWDESELVSPYCDLFINQRGSCSISICTNNN